MCRHIDAKRRIGVKVMLPLGSAGKVINIFFVVVIRIAEAKKDAAGNAACHARTHCRDFVGAKAHARAGGFGALRTGLTQLVFQNRFEPERAQCIVRTNERHQCLPSP